MPSSRQEKLDNIVGEKYPRDFPGRVSVQDCLIAHTLDNKRTEPIKYIHGNVIKIAGRIVSRRDHGNNIFFDLMDQTGEIQLHAKNNDNEQPNPQQEAFVAALDCDLGDMVGVEGIIGANPRGEPLFLISNWTLLAKALKEPPDKHHGLSNPEVKYRHRELDLLSSPDSRELFKTRAQIVFEIRSYLNARDFIEIECPVLQPIYGGATARPFKTFHNSLGQDFFLSISSELYLKRTMVGGFDRVYSFSKCFRNEGISPTHNPEFTNLEIFESCKTADDMESFTNHIIEHLWDKFTPLDNQLFVHNFMRSMPSSDWPLSRKLSTPMQPNNVHKNPNYYADAWELYINDIEIASGASDLNDPREQESRLEESEINAITRSENPENADFDPMDKNYIEALEQGALPWAGVGIGIDRLVMLLTGKTNIRDVIMFPTLKSK